MGLSSALLDDHKKSFNPPTSELAHIEAAMMRESKVSHAQRQR